MDKRKQAKRKRKGKKSKRWGSEWTGEKKEG